MKIYILFFGIIFIGYGKSTAINVRNADKRLFCLNPGHPFKVKIQYFSAAGRILPSAVGADHRREIVYYDSIAGIVREFYPSGKLKSSTEYTNLRLQLKYGMHTDYYENGQLGTQEEFVAGKLQGERLRYYPTGILNRRDIYKNGVRISGEYFAPNGKPARYVEEIPNRPTASSNRPLSKSARYVEEMPRYEKGGFVEIIAAVTAKAKYPFLSQLMGTEGKVYIAFTVNTKGDVMDIKVIKSASILLDAAAVDAVEKLHRFAAPGKQQGKPVSVAFTVPITFKIQ